MTAVLESSQGQAARDRLPQDQLVDTEMKTILEILCRFRQINVDSSEVGCMKAIILFSPETRQLCDIQPIEMLQDQAQCILSDHVRLRYPRQQTRFGRLLLLLPSLRAIRKTTVEQLFFKETIGGNNLYSYPACNSVSSLIEISGNVRISQILVDMYHMEKYTEVEA